MNNWIKVSEKLPQSRVVVLAHYTNSHNMHRIIRACWIKQFTEECSPEDEAIEYCEEDDIFYTPEGWWEQIDNWDDYSQVAVHQGEITHWAYLPSPPLE